jgi:hypothetical protein
MKYRQSSMNETAAASGDDSPPGLVRRTSANCFALLREYGCV